MSTKWIIGIIIAIIVIVGAYLVLAGGGTTINMAGSTSVQPVAEKLAQAYMGNNSNIKINVQGGGTAVGIKSTQDGTAQIGMASSKPKDNESQGLVQTQIAKDGIVIIVNKANTLTGLTTQQAADIFSGKITQWSQVPGASGGQITVVTREEGSGTRDGFTKLVMNNTNITKTAIVQSSTEAINQAVKGDPNAIGYISLDAFKSDQVTGLSINGVAPSQATVSDGTYKIQRPFILLTKGNPTGDVKKFIDWILSPAGQKIVQQSGAVPIGPTS